MKSAPQLLVLVGVPGCGKSTWCQQVQRHGYQVVSTDRIRKQIWSSLRSANSELQPFNNEIVFTHFHLSLRARLAAGANVIADATNLTQQSRTQLLDLADEYKAQTKFIVFDNSKARKYNQQRAADIVVPAEVMDEMEVLYQQAIQELRDSSAEVIDSEKFLRCF